MDKTTRLAFLRARHAANPKLSNKASKMMEEILEDENKMDLPKCRSIRINNDEEAEKESFQFASSLENVFDSTENEINKFEKDLAN